MQGLKKLKKTLAYHLVDSTAILVESCPVYSAFEVGIAGMSNATSINSRLFVTALTYAGLGGAYAKGRDLLRNFFRINEESSEKVQSLCDTIYNAVFNLALSPPLYFACGSRDLKEIIIGTGCALVFGAINGTPSGYVIDIFRDLTDLRECKRKSYPNSVKKQKPFIKKTLATLLTVASIGIVSGIYALTPNKSISENYDTLVVQESIENPSPN